MTQSGHARSIGAGADDAALLRAALATDLATDLAGRQLRFGDAADGVLQMRRPIGLPGLNPALAASLGRHNL